MESIQPSTQSIPEIFSYLKDIANNNNREWFWENRSRYDSVRLSFESIVAQLILRVGEFDPSIRGLQVNDCVYRFYRDTRFSLDKSPYKRHLGAYLSAKGKKSLHGGYYLHLEPGQCLIASGCYCLPTSILKVIRQKIVNNSEEFESIVEDVRFKQIFPSITMSPLKALPRDASKDYPHPEYLKCKSYTVWKNLDDQFFMHPQWLDQVVEQFKLSQPFVDFINEVVDDYI